MKLIRLWPFAACALLILAGITIPVGGIATQQPGPPPRVVYERPTPGRARLYTVQVFRDGIFQMEFGSDRHWELNEILYTIALRYCTPPHDFERQEDGMLDLGKPVKRPLIEVAIWGEPEQLWIYPDIKRPGRREFFALPLTVRVNVGNTGIE